MYKEKTVELASWLLERGPVVFAKDEDIADAIGVLPVTVFRAIDWLDSEGALHAGRRRQGVRRIELKPDHDIWTHVGAVR